MRAADQGVRVIPLKEAVSKLVDGSHNPPPKREVGKPMLSARNIENGRIVFDEYRFIDETAFEQEHARSRVAANDVLLTIVGTIGRTAVVSEGLPPFALQRSVAVLTPRDDLLPKYLCYQLQSPATQRYFEENARGTAQKGVYLKTLGATPIQVPPLDEQREVVDEIEKQFSRLDEAVANLQRVKANLKRYKASVLKAAVEGRLVETEASIAQRESRSYETGEQLLQRILDERRAKWSGKRKYKEPLPHDAQGLSKTPEGWVWCSLDLVASETLIGLDRGRDQQRAEAVGVRYVKMNNVSMDGDVQTDELVYIDATPEEVARYEVANSDLLFNTRNSLELVGKVGIVRSIPACTVFNNNLMRIRTCGGVSPVFLGYQMCAFEFRQRMAKVKKATTSVAAVYQKDLLPLAIALPPESEQVRIVAEIDRHLSIIREVEAEVDTNLQRAQALRQGTLAKFFSYS